MNLHEFLNIQKNNLEFDMIIFAQCNNFESTVLGNTYDKTQLCVSDILLRLSDFFKCLKYEGYVINYYYDNANDFSLQNFEDSNSYIAHSNYYDIILSTFNYTLKQQSIGIYIKMLH